MNFCEKCGNKLVPNDKFCRNCGAALTGSESAGKPETAKTPVSIQTPPEPVYHHQPVPPAYLNNPPAYTVEPKKKSPWKTIIIFWVISFLLLMIIAGGIAGYFIYFKGSGTSSEEVSKSDIKSDKKTTARDNTGNGEKTITSEETKTTIETVEKTKNEEKKTGFRKREKRSGDCGDYPELSERKLDPSELEGLSAKEKRYMKNDIYMRRGYIFQDEDLLLHYALFRCYEPKYMNVERYLSEIEKYNIRLLK